MRLILILIVGLMCGCRSTRPAQPKRDVEIGIDVPVGAIDKAKVTATIKASF